MSEIPNYTPEEQLAPEKLLEEVKKKRTNVELLKNILVIAKNAGADAVKAIFSSKRK